VQVAKSFLLEVCRLLFLKAVHSKRLNTYPRKMRKVLSQKNLEGPRDQNKHVFNSSDIWDSTQNSNIEKLLKMLVSKV
jgi:hypothetical protein